jgi:plastocyanin
VNSFVLSLCALLLAGLLAAPAPGSAKGVTVEVEIEEGRDMASWDYSPSALSVPLGATVQWRNTGSLAHSVTSQDQLFDSRLLDENRTWSYTFETSGTYRYFCVPHPWMKGTIVVRPAEMERSSDRRDQADNSRDEDESEEQDQGSGDGDNSPRASRDVEGDSATPLPSPTSRPSVTPTVTPAPTVTPTATPTTAPLFPFFAP